MVTRLPKVDTLTTGTSPRARGKVGLSTASILLVLTKLKTRGMFLHFRSTMKAPIGTILGDAQHEFPIAQLKHELVFKGGIDVMVLASYTPGY
jgi:hypothetical protein